MATAERVSRRNVVSAAALALSTTEDAVAKVDELVGQHNALVDTVAKHEQARYTALNAHAKTFAEHSVRIDSCAAALVFAADRSTAIEHQLGEKASKHAHIITSDRLDVVHCELVKFQTMTLFGRLRWLVTGQS